MNPRDKFFNRVSQNFSSEHLDLINDLWHASGLDEALRRRSVGTLAKFQPCGCVICTCEDDEQCHGCGARMCGTHPGKPIPNPVYESQQAVGVDEAMVRDAARYRLLKSRTKIFEHYFVVDYLESDDADARVDVLIGVDALRHATATLRQSADSGRVGEDLQKWFNGAPRWSYIKVPNVGKELVEREEAEQRIAALEAALSAQQGQGHREAVAWQINATLTSRGWESCTRECYEDTLLTGRYMGFPEGTKAVEVRELFTAPPAQPAEAVIDFAGKGEAGPFQIVGGKITLPQVTLDDLRDRIAQPAECVPEVSWLADQLCDLRNKWAESCEANWLETDDNHPDDWMAKELHKRLIASPTPPQHGQPEPPCSLDEALAVIDAWASHGGQVHGAAAARLRSLTDRIAPLHGQPCDVGDEVIETFRMLRAEKQRMDFIEAHPGWLSVRRHKRKTLWLCAPFSNYEQDLHATARDAIDAALAAQPTQPAEGE